MAYLPKKLYGVDGTLCLPYDAAVSVKCNDDLNSESIYL